MSDASSSTSIVGRIDCESGSISCLILGRSLSQNDLRRSTDEMSQHLRSGEPATERGAATDRILLILEKCLSEHIDSYVVFEDDAGFAEDFAEQLNEFVDELPPDWGMAYLGGQHLYAGKHPPHKVSEHVYRPYNVNRTHAFMVRGRDNMKALYRHLTWNDWHTKHHIDHHLGRFIQRRYESLVQGKNVQRESIAVYTPDRWMVGQLPTKSNICGRKWNQTRFFNDARNADHSDAPFFAVLGTAPRQVRLV